LIQDEVLHDEGNGKVLICGRNIDQTWTGGKSIVQLGIFDGGYQARDDSLGAGTKTYRLPIS
jgi:hypothetical protein